MQAGARRILQKYLHRRITMRLVPCHRGRAILAGHQLLFPALASEGCACAQNGGVRITQGRKASHLKVTPAATSCDTDGSGIRLSSRLTHTLPCSTPLLCLCAHLPWAHSACCTVAGHLKEGQSLPNTSIKRCAPPLARTPAGRALLLDARSKEEGPRLLSMGGRDSMGGFIGIQNCRARLAAWDQGTAASPARPLSPILLHWGSLFYYISLGRGGRDSPSYQKHQLSMPAYHPSYPACPSPYTWHRTASRMGLKTLAASYLHACGDAGRKTPGGNIGRTGCAAGPPRGQTRRKPPRWAPGRTSTNQAGRRGWPAVPRPTGGRSARTGREDTCHTLHTRRTPLPSTSSTTRYTHHLH